MKRLTWFLHTHMGHYADGQHGSEAPVMCYLLVHWRKGNWDAIIGGHSQNPVCMGR